MNNQMDTPVRSISMEQWCAWSKTDSAPAVTTRLYGDIHCLHRPCGRFKWCTTRL